MSKKYDNKAFQIKILKLDPICMRPHCNNPAVSGHHIIYKSQWSSVIEQRLGFDRDDIRNGLSLCAEDDYKGHNGLGTGKMSGREFVYDILDAYNEKTVYFHRYKAVKEELKKSLIRKGIEK